MALFSPSFNRGQFLAVFGKNAKMANLTQKELDIQMLLAAGRQHV